MSYTEPAIATVTRSTTNVACRRWVTAGYDEWIAV